MHALRRRTFCASLALALVVLGACGDDDKAEPGDSTTPPTTESTDTSDPTATTGDAPGTTEPPVTYPPVKPGEGTDAEGRISDSLIAGRFVAQQVAKLKNDATNLDEFAKIVEGQYPEVELVGPDETATPNTISSTFTTFDPSKDAGPQNVRILSFTVMDTHDKCVGIVFFGYPDITGEIEKLYSFVGAPITCNADEGINWVRDRLPQ
jgi:hypothetical protein